MKRVLVFIGHYLPATRVGGPVMSTYRMTEAVDGCDFYIYTSETDFKTDLALEGIAEDSWQQRGKANVFYASRGGRKLRVMRRIVSVLNPDAIYLHGFFSRRFTIPVLFLRRFGLLPKVPVILAPRGEFAPGALAIKRLRKKAYLRVAALAGLTRRVIWHATSKEEFRDIKRVQGGEATIVLAPNLPAPPESGAYERHTQKDESMARLVSLSRICEMKNLLGALSALKYCTENVGLDIYGPIEEPDYWDSCQKAIRSLPENVTVSYKGEIAPGSATDVLGQYDALFLPTFGENFGHAIVEAWAAATPVIISDRTPWLDLEAGKTGWNAHPTDYEGFAKIIDRLSRMTEEIHQVHRKASWDKALTLSDNNRDLVKIYQSMLMLDQSEAGGRSDD